MNAVDTFMPSLTQRCSLALEEERGEVRGRNIWAYGWSQSWEFCLLEYSPDLPPEQQGPGRKQGVPTSMGKERAEEH